MSHVHDSDRTHSLEMMAVGVLIQMLFGERATPKQARIDAHIKSSSVFPEVSRVFTGVHLVAAWRGSRRVVFEDIQTRPSTSVEGGLTVHVCNDQGWSEGELRQLRHGLDVIGCEDVSGSYSAGDVATRLIFTLPAQVMARLHGSAQALAPALNVTPAE
jgi:hypothetical protein